MVTSLPVSGSRAKVWPFAPNWSSPYRITYEFSTEILTSWSGREQRIANRFTPRKAITYLTTLRGPALQRFKDLMWTWQDKAFVLPEETRKTRSIGSTPPGSTYMDISTPLPEWVTPGATVMLDSDTLREIRVIDSLVGNRVIFKSASATEWPAGTTVFYAVTGYFDTSLSSSRKTSDTVTLDLTMNVVPLSETFITFGAPGLSINGREIFDKRPNWSTDVAVTNQHDVQQIDYGRGPITRFSPIEFGTMLRKHIYLARNLSQADDMLKFFCRMAGQQGEFYAPTWEPDVVPKIAAPVGTSTLRVAGRDFYDAYTSSTVNKGLAVRMNDGSMVYRMIQSIDLVEDLEGQDSLITIVGTWNQVVSVGTIQYISWLLLWRFGTDSLTIEYLTDTVAQFQLTIRSLEDLAPET